MDNQVSDSDTDDGHPPSNQNRVLRGSSDAGNIRSAVTSVEDVIIHQAEKDAYSSVLRAFKYQSDSLSWEKEKLITDLRKELRVSNDEYTELLRAVNTDETIQSIRKWRQTGRYQLARCSSTSQPVHEVLPCPTASSSRKKQKASKSSTAGIDGAALGSRGQRPNNSSTTIQFLTRESAKKKHALMPFFFFPPIWHQLQSLLGMSSVKSMQHPSAGPARGRHFTDRSFYSVLPSKAPAQAPAHDPLIGKKALIRWPQDNQFYEAVITKYDPAKRQHALVYDSNKTNETFEWVDLKEIPPEDIRWEGEDRGIPQRGHSGQGLRVKIFCSGDSDTQGAGRKRVRFNLQATEEFPSQQNVIGKRVLDEIELLDTDVLVKEVKRILAVSPPDSMKLEEAKKMLKEQEQALVDAIARLEDASDGESEGN